MKKKLLKLLVITILISTFLSCSNSDKDFQQTKYNKDEISKIVNDHLDITISTFQDSMDAKKGFLGWKNIRDYVGLGEEGFQDRTLRTWNKVYDNKALEKKIEDNLKTEQSVNIELNKADKQISQYIHKISLSFAVLIGEGFFDFLLDIFFGFTFAAVEVFAYVTYQFSYGKWKRISKKRSERVESIDLKTAH